MPCGADTGLREAHRVWVASGRSIATSRTRAVTPKLKVIFMVVQELSLARRHGHMTGPD